LESVPDTHNLSEEVKEKVRDDIYTAAERGISELRSVPVEKLTRKVAGSINGMIDGMRARGVAETTIFGHRWKIVSMFRWVELQVNEEKLVDFIKEVSVARITDNRQPEPIQIRTMLIKGSSKQKAFLSFLVCTGGRMGEAVQVKLSDIFWDEKPVRVEFPARKTKTAQIRYSYLSSECVGFLKDYIAERERVQKSAWLFDGEERHMTTAMGWQLIHGLFVKAGLIDEKEEEKNEVAGAGTGAHHAFHPHVLRDTNLGIAKLAGYPDSWAEFLAGHSTGS
jgi:integrase